MTLGEHLTETDENDGGGDEEEEEEEEEVPDNLTFGEKTLGLLVEGINKFQNNLLEFCSFSSKQSSETNSLLGLEARLDPLYTAFKHQLEALIRERIAPQYQNLNFKEMRLVQHLGPVLNDIESKYFKKKVYNGFTK